MSVIHDVWIWRNGQVAQSYAKAGNSSTDGSPFVDEVGPGGMYVGPLSSDLGVLYAATELDLLRKVVAQKRLEINFCPICGSKLR